MMQTSVINFIMGLSVGLVFAFIATTHFATTRSGHGMVLTKYHRQFDHQAGESSLAEITNGSYMSHEAIDKIQQLVKPMEFNDKHVHHDDDAEAKRLFEKVRILCWVMTSPQNHEKKAIHVKKTWGKRCNKLIFISSQKNDTLPSVALNVSEGREHLTAKTMMAFRFVYENFMEEADWFMKADDDTYVILENLRYFLSSENTNDPVFFGHHFKTIVKQGYFSGGAGYILSKESLRRFGARANNSKICRQDGGAEDAEFGKCMENLGVKVGNSTDALGRSRFHCFDPETHMSGGYPNWYYSYDAHGGKKGRESISDYPISFHYVGPSKMYYLEYYIYHLRPYGIKSENQMLNQKPQRV